MSYFKPAITISVTLLVLLLAPISVSAQWDDSKKFEVGVQVSMLGEGIGTIFPGSASLGGGGRLTFNLNRYLAIEGEMNYFPAAGYNNLRTLQGQFGIKSGVRFNRFGLFGKIRPGFQTIKFEHRVYCLSTSSLCPFKGKDSGFALDVGGVLEFYPIKRITVRFDVGDTIVTSDGDVYILGTGADRFFATLGRQTSNSLQLSSGIGFRF